jgi:hypothetical protein
MRDSVVYENTAEMHSALVNGNGSHKTVITGSTFSRNTNTTYPANGVIHLSNFVNSEGHVTLTNVTVSGNTGSGIEASGAYTTMNHCTVAGNSKYGLLFSGGGLYELTLRNSILSGNSPNCGPTSQNVTSAGFNIDSSSADCLSFNKPGDMRNTDPKLRPLDNYGGLTLTHNLFSSSPAVNAADSSDCPATDQRGRPRPFGAGCDIGAVEYDGTGGPPPKPTPWLILLLGD